MAAAVTPLWPILISGLIGLAGPLAAQWLARRAERDRRDHDTAERWRLDKQAAYVDFLTACNGMLLAHTGLVAGEAGDHFAKASRDFLVCHHRVALIAPPPVVEAAGALVTVISEGIIAGNALPDAEPAGIRNEIIAFTEAARDDIGVPGGRLFPLTTDLRTPRPRHD